jgi:hypothetical protein
MQKKSQIGEAWQNAKPYAWGFGAGMVFLAAAAQFWPGYMLDSNVQGLVTEASVKGKLAGYTPGCVARFLASPNYAANREVLAKSSTWSRENGFPGELRELITLPGETRINDQLARDCAELILKPQTAAAATTTTK